MTLAETLRTVKNMYIPANACVRRKVLGGRALGTATAAVADGKVREVRARPFQEIPHTGSSGWFNLLKFWREDRFRQLHVHMEKTFSKLGPIYR